jgi:hypothetical protein
MRGRPGQPIRAEQCLLNRLNSPPSIKFCFRRFQLCLPALPWLSRSIQMNGPFSLAFAGHTLPQSNCLAEELTYLELNLAGTK